MVVFHKRALPRAGQFFHFVDRGGYQIAWGSRLVLLSVDCLNTSIVLRATALPKQAGTACLQ